MTAIGRIERRHRAYMQLAEYARWKASRDALVREAVAAGIPRTEVAAIIGLHRSTVGEILARQDGKGSEDNDHAGA